MSGLLREALRERRNISFRKIQIHTLQAMDGKENNAGGKGLSALDLRGQIIERCDINSAQAKTFSRKMKDCTPILFPRRGQSNNYDRTRTKRYGSFRFLIKTNAGHIGIVVCKG